MTASILIVDDEETICWALRKACEQEGYRAQTVSRAETALELLKTEKFDVLILDIRLPGMDGLTAISLIRALHPDLPIIVITAFGSLGTVVRSMRSGAVEYLAKPFDLAEMLSVIRGAIAARSTPQSPDAELTAVETDGIVGSSPAMQEVYKRLALVSAVELPVLITGESGTGKELVARAIHRHSPRAERPFLPVHLASLNPTLIESELFGHVRGAFTGADSARSGVLESAHGATLFFDEVGDVPPAAQVKLLRVLEQGEFTPVGDVQPRPSNFRLLAATNRDLRQAMATGALREDFYFRLAVFEIRLPALRERAEDIPALARHFLRCAAGTDAHPGFSDEALSLLLQRAWPGNVRELRNAVQYAALLSRGQMIEAKHLPPPRFGAPTEPPASLADFVRRWTLAQLADPAAAGDLHARFLAEAEKSLFQAVVEQHGGNRTAAASLLGIDRATLRKRLD